MSSRLQFLLHRWPRLAGAIAFGVPAAALVHFAWYSDARMSGIHPELTAAAGLAHAVAGFLTGPLLLGGAAGGRSTTRALAVGGATSLLALAVFAPAMAAWLLKGSASAPSVLGYVVTTVYTAFFAFLGAGWALLLLSALVGLALHGVASRRGA